MPYLLSSVVCSVLVSVLLKLMQRRGIDTAQGIAWNYLAASLLCFALLDPPLLPPERHRRRDQHGCQHRLLDRLHLA